MLSSFIPHHRLCRLCSTWQRGCNPQTQCDTAPSSDPPRPLRWTTQGPTAASRPLCPCWPHPTLPTHLSNCVSPRYHACSLGDALHLDLYSWGHLVCLTLRALNTHSPNVKTYCTDNPVSSLPFPHLKSFLGPLSGQHFFCDCPSP